MLSHLQVWKIVSRKCHFSVNHWRASSMCILPVNGASIRLYSANAHFCESFKAQNTQMMGIKVKTGGIDTHTRFERNAKKLRSAVIKSLQTDIKVSML